MAHSSYSELEISSVLNVHKFIVYDQIVKRNFFIFPNNRSIIHKFVFIGKIDLWSQSKNHFVFCFYFNLKRLVLNVK